MTRIRPLFKPIGILLAGIFFGALFGSGSVSINSTAPWQLHPDFQAVYVSSVADAYGTDGNMQQALTRIGYLCGQEGVTNAINIARTQTLDAEQLANLDNLAPLASQWTPSPTANSSEVCSTSSTGTLSSISSLLKIVAILGVLGFAGWAVYNIIQERQGGGASTASGAKPATLGGSRASSKKAPTLAKAKSPAAKGAAIAATTEKTDFVSSGKPPIVQFMTTFLEGDDLFDDSFSVETAGGEFLGETGVGISETIGVGEPKHVTAMEVWLFDKNDIRTVTKVLMSDHAFNDESLKAKLAPKGEAALAQAGSTVMLETATLRVQAKVVDVEYGSGALPPNSFFQRITIELAAWKRDEAKTPTP